MTVDDQPVSLLVAALLTDTPMVEDLRVLTDEIGGRPTGSEANMAAVEWAVGRFQEAGVKVTKEPFTMPALWLERSAQVEVVGDVSFKPRVASMPFSAAADGLTAPLIDAGLGTDEDFERLGDSCRDAFVLIETTLLTDIPGLFKEYTDAAMIERRAFAAGVAGVVYMGSRPNDLLHRHNASLGPRNRHPMLVMERDAATRAQRLLRAGKQLNLKVFIDIEDGGEYESFNVIGEIRGHEKPQEVVVIGAHIDSWGLGTGALDNGCNVAMVIDIARQLQRLGLTPRRTIRFALFNGEEQGMLGSWAYVKTHAGELEHHIMAASYDIGAGPITGFFTNGREQLLAFLDTALAPVAGLGGFENLNVPIVGTDNYDFMMEGIVNLVANQAAAGYGPNYHARSDTFDKVDQRQLRLNAAIAAAVTFAFADTEGSWPRQSRDQIQALIDSTDLGEQMRTFGLMELWEKGIRGRQLR
jgi:hypothetical protein